MPPLPMPVNSFSSLSRAMTVYRPGALLPALPRPTAKALQVARPVANKLILHPTLARPPANSMIRPPAVEMRITLPEPVAGGRSVLSEIGNSIYDWMFGGGGGGKIPPKPPAFSAEVEVEDIDLGNPELCIAIGVVSLASACEDAEDNRDKREQLIEAAGGTVKNKGQFEPEDVVSLPKKVKDAEKALKACLTKKLSTQAQLKQLLLDMFKSHIKQLLKDKLVDYAKKNLKFKRECEQVIARAKRDAQKLKADAEAECGVTVAHLQDWNKKVARDLKTIRQAKKKTNAIFQDMTKEYSDIVKATDGLTSVVPGVVKAIEKYVDTGKAHDLAAARTAMKAHRDKVLRTNPGSDLAQQFADRLTRMMK